MNTQWLYKAMISKLMTKIKHNKMYINLSKNQNFTIKMFLVLNVLRFFVRLFKLINFNKLLHI